MKKSVAIFGGGFSGLAAGVALSEGDYEVVVLEGRDYLGGRAYSFTDSRTGSTVDNGQHLFLGCYHRTVAFLDKIGCLDRLKFQNTLRVDFLERDHGLSTLDCPQIPAPGHLLAGLVKLSGLTAGDKLRAINVGRAIRNSSDARGSRLESQTVGQWLDSLDQSNRIKSRFWFPMAIACLNQDPNIAPAQLFSTVLRAAFGGRRSDSSIGIASVGLSDLYTDGARRFIEERGSRVRTGARVSRLLIERDRVVAAELRSGEKVQADCYISAVPHTALAELLPAELRTGSLADLTRLGSSPIVSINLWFDRPITDREFAGLLGTRIQWLFNKDEIAPANRQTNHIAIVISAARGFVDWSNQSLVEMALSELNDLLPASRDARLEHSIVVREREATMSHTVESDRLRPGTRTSVQNLFLAGDWTATGLPATIESAVLSGNLAAESIRSME